MPPNADPDLPLLDLTVLGDLERQLGEPGPARAFVRDYIAAFGDRYLRLERSITDQDPAAALEAVLSLRSSSIMVGAERLAALASALGTAVSSASPGSARRALPELERCGLATIGKLETLYLDPV
ncbi:hypothetical protein C4K88_09110 [Arthrobacter pityocampae]|uniref:Hpt domain-containing protein n=1 Tax=Arthrobacter pityocampae TaxID=547334 RepID=A0A2S5IWI5_9MICC|nr:hypothetical protein [Arthrobacter pityocampae]PPB48890.1 hypothetical protein C4K88_09110 [Arthrobacter pityocampae]